MKVPPARYAPWTKGVYDVAPGLKPFGADFGNGEADCRLFQIDSEAHRYSRNKSIALAERREKYMLRDRLSPVVEQGILHFASARLASEYPLRVFWPCCSLDDFALLIQEDFAVVSTSAEGDWASYLSICSPSHWSPEAKIGKSFFTVHEGIPGFTPVNNAAPGLVRAMLEKGPHVRFVWGIESDDRLNHHPVPPDGEDAATWDGRRFSDGRFWVRTERQVVWGFPELGAALFTIRVGFVPDSEILPDPTLREPLVRALESMSPEARAYKGLAAGWDDLMALLR